MSHFDLMIAWASNVLYELNQSFSIIRCDWYNKRLRFGVSRVGNPTSLNKINDK